MTASEDLLHQHGRLVRQIADALGIPVVQLLDADAFPFTGELLDLIRSYTSIDDAQGRQRVLNAARREAVRARSSVRSNPPVD